MSRCIVWSASELPLDSADTSTSSDVDSAGADTFAIARPLRRTNAVAGVAGEPSALPSARRKKWVRLTRGLQRANGIHVSTHTCDPGPAGYYH